MIRKIVSGSLLILGILLLAQGLFNLSKRVGLYRPTVINHSPSIQPLQDLSSFPPVKISISNISINLPVESVTIKNGKWPTSQIGVSFLANSGQVGKTGNLIFYGHNWKNLLGNLKSAKINDTVAVELDNGQVFVYTVSYIAEVDQNDVSILADSKDERLTLYTCSGILDQKRLVVVAKRV